MMPWQNLVIAIFLLGIAFVFISFHPRTDFKENCQNLHPQGIENTKIKVVGTGNTTGNIATLQVENFSSETFSFESKGFFIPSDGNYQSYVVPYPLNFSVEASEKIQIPIFGYCSDVNTPPVPNGTEMVAFSNWIFHSEEWFDDLVLDLDAFYNFHGFKQDELSQVISENPFIFNSLYFYSLKTNAEFEDYEPEGYIIMNHLPPEKNEFLNNHALVIPSKDSFSFGMLILDAAFSLIKTVNELQDEGQLITPLTGTEEREVLMQHSIWIYSTILAGKIYSKEDFNLKFKEELQRQTGMTYNEMSKEMKNIFRSGVEQFWTAFLKMGEMSGTFGVALP